MSKKSERGKSVIIKKINLYAFKLKSGKKLFAEFQDKIKPKGGHLEKLKKEGLNLCFTIKFRNLENEAKMCPGRGKSDLLNKL